MLKTLTFALLHFAVAFGATYTLTGSIGIAGGVALIEPLANTVVFYFHDKVWKRIENRNTASATDHLPCRTICSGCPQTAKDFNFTMPQLTMLHEPQCGRPG